jgi:DEAD/DEAH box helicase domain-containing protein
VASRLELAGIGALYTHQAAVRDLVRDGRDVVVATGTASGKSLAYQLPVLEAIVAEPTTSALYLAPTKALTRDQLRSVRGFKLPQVRAAVLDGDTPRPERDAIRRSANWILTNPDLLHHSLLPGHQTWRDFLHRLRFVIVDEAHVARGVFGSHVALILRRLRRLAERYGADPTFVLASATIGNPAEHASELVGRDVVAVVEDGAPRGPLDLGLWQPPLTDPDQGVRRSLLRESGDLLASFVGSQVQTLVFTRSRKGAELIATFARERLGDDDPLADTVRAYRGGYLPEERRALEEDLRAGRLVGLAATEALELGIDVSGLDAVLVAGFPGTRAAFWQQVGRAGRGGQDALGVLVARDDPLDTYLVTHPEALIGRPVEANVFDPDNPYVLGPHLCAAAEEAPLGEDDLELFGPQARAGVEALTAAGMLRRRPRGWFWTDRSRACDLADIRSTGGPPIRLVEEETGRMVGTVDRGSAHGTVHQGAVYLHLGETYLVRTLDLEDHVAIVSPANPDYSTSAREVTDIAVRAERGHATWGSARMSLGEVRVTHQVVSYLRRRVPSGEVLGEELLDLPERVLDTVAVWWTLPAAALEEAGLAARDLPGAAHAAEHAAIGLLPLFATCDRWDIGGVSTALHPDTGQLTVFVYDGHPGGAGFAERGFDQATTWWTATREAIASCGCEDGCPSCVQSPKCGNGNNPLDKHGAVALLDVLLRHAPARAPAPAPAPE